MKRARIAIGLSGVITVASATLSPLASAASGPLAGTWTSIDIPDGSSQTLDIRGSGARVYSMLWLDHGATACGGDPAQISGPGYPDGDDLIMVGALKCLPGGNFIRSRIAIGFVYDGSADTLTDEFGVVWHRTS
jgi:hypothetical protein